MIKLPLCCRGRGSKSPDAPWPSTAKTCAFPVPTSAESENRDIYASTGRKGIESVSRHEPFTFEGGSTMQIEYTGRQVTLTRALRSQAEAGIERIAKILGKVTSAHIILSATKYRHTAEVTIKTRLTKIVGVAECPNMETSLRDALIKAETQAIRARKKLQAKKRQPKEEKVTAEPQLLRPRKPAKVASVDEEAPAAPKNGNGR